MIYEVPWSGAESWFRRYWLTTSFYGWRRDELVFIRSVVDGRFLETKTLDNGN